MAQLLDANSTPVMSCAGDGSNFRPFVVHSDRVVFKFSANHGPTEETYWGYRFHVSPMMVCVTYS